MGTVRVVRRGGAKVEKDDRREGGKEVRRIRDSYEGWNVQGVSSVDITRLLTRPKWSSFSKSFPSKAKKRCERGDDRHRAGKGI